MTAWHGWGVGPHRLHIGRVPGRKSVALYAQYDGESRVLAYFRNEDDAREALNLIDVIAFAQVAA